MTVINYVECNYAVFSGYETQMGFYFLAAELTLNRSLKVVGHCPSTSKHHIFLPAFHSKCVIARIMPRDLGPSYETLLQ